MASLERSASRVLASSKARANQLTADLKWRRDEFQAAVNKEAEAGEAAWEGARTQLEAQ